jgi:hypothetical protein
MDGLCADVARLTLSVLGARIRRDRYGLRVLITGMVLLGAAGPLYPFAELVMAAFFPVLRLAGRPAVARAAAAAFLSQSEAKWGSAGGAVCEDHCVLLRWQRCARRQPELWSYQRL